MMTILAYAGIVRRRHLSQSEAVLYFENGLPLNLQILHEPSCGSRLQSASSRRLSKFENAASDGFA